MSEPDAPRDQAFWQGLYDAADTRWDLGRPAPPLVAWADADAGPRGRAIVPGCGRGHDALLLAERGWDVVGVDFAPTAVSDARAAAAARGLAGRARFDQADWLAAPARGDWVGAFDLVLEHTCVCALDPAQRPAYVEAAAAALRPGGRIVGLLWACGRAGGPPYHTDPDEMRRLFEARFTIERLEAVDPTRSARPGEWLLLARRF